MADKKHFTEEDRKENRGAPMDNPEQFKTDKETINEMHDEQMTVDSIPLEDLKQEQREEQNPRHTKDSSSSDEKFPE